MESKLKRGNVYWVNLNPTQGSEIKKIRPCVLVGASPLNQARRTTGCPPLSTWRGETAHYRNGPLSGPGGAGGLRSNQSH